MAREEPTDDLSRAAVSSFTGLDDTPDSLAANTRHLVRVNPASNALEFFAELADLVVGNGFNVLRVVDNGGTLELQMFDVQDLIVSLTGANNRSIQAPTLVVPVPSLTNNAAAASAAASGVTENLTVPVPTLTPSAAENSATPESANVDLTVPVPALTANAALV